MLLCSPCIDWLKRRRFLLHFKYRQADTHVPIALGMSKSETPCKYIIHDTRTHNNAYILPKGFIFYYKNDLKIIKKFQMNSNQLYNMSFIEAFAYKLDIIR